MLPVKSRAAAPADDPGETISTLDASTRSPVIGSEEW
jgi:hypothetical protein